MPVTLYTEEEVTVYTRMLVRAYRVIRGEFAGDEETAKRIALKEIEVTLGWKTPPPMTAPPPADEPSEVAIRRDRSEWDRG